MNACPVCDSTRFTSLLELDRVPVLCNALASTREAALAAPVGRIALVACDACGHVFNRAFDPAAVSYDETYENALHFSERFRSYADALTKRLVKEYDLHGRRIVEVGAGSGEMLRAICERGPNRGIGFEPRAENRRWLSPNVVILPVDYAADHADAAADLVCCRHVLEHVADPVDLLRTLRRPQRADTVIYVEVPNGEHMLREGGLWDVIYEHPSCFLSVSLRHAVRRAGLRPVRFAEDFAGQFLCVDARPVDPSAPSERDEHRPAVDTAAFRRLAAERRARTRAVLEEAVGRGHRIALWGAGSKGVMLLSLNRDAGIDAVVDVSPRKAGRFVPGTGHRIDPPESLREHPPDLIVLSNPIYEEEVRSRLDALGLNTSIFLA